jgi:phosphodiesterase/alkaline phosphatase D-like protein
MEPTDRSAFGRRKFLAYRHMAEEDLDLVVHVGDYIYDTWDDHMRLYRRRTFGRLAEFNVLDTRSYRTDQPCGGRSSWGRRSRRAVTAPIPT